MPQIGDKNVKKTSSDSKRHFTVVMGNKEHGLYVSSTPSSAAKKAVTKLCTSNKSKKVELYIREITQGSKKKTYGPYVGYIEKLKNPIELKGRVIRYKSVAKLIGKSVAKKGGGEKNKANSNENNPVHTFNSLNNFSSNSAEGLSKTVEQKKKNAQKNQENANKAKIKASELKITANASKKQATENQQKANEMRKIKNQAKNKANESERNFSNLQKKYPEVKLNKTAENSGAAANPANAVVTSPVAAANAAVTSPVAAANAAVKAANAANAAAVNTSKGNDKELLEQKPEFTKNQKRLLGLTSNN